MQRKQLLLATIIVITSLILSACGPNGLLGPTLTPTSTNTIIPTNTPIPTNTQIPTITPTAIPGIGVSLQAFQTSFEKLGFTFKTTENNHVQGDNAPTGLGSPNTWVMLQLKGRQENLSEATLMVLNDHDKESAKTILNLFFQVAFPVQSERDEAMDWFANKSGLNTQKNDGSTNIGSINISWIRGVLDPSLGYSISITPKAK
jgi:hypothetical protein